MKNKINSWERIFIFLVVSAILIRIFLFLAIQYPAPVADSSIFAAVAMSECRGENLISPLYQYNGIDNRYLWHAIGMPFIVSLLNYNCTNFGQYFAISIIIAATFLLGLRITGFPKNVFKSLLFCSIVVALQVKSEFRPETLIIPMVLLVEIIRNIKNNYWIIIFSLCAWIQPTVFLIYLCYILVSTSIKDIRSVLSDIKILALCALTNFIIIYNYPYNILEHIMVLAHQGSSVYRENLVANDFYVYYVKSNFFPTFGILFIILFIIGCFKNIKLALMLPLLYFVAFSHFATIYTLYTLFLLIYLDLFKEENKKLFLNIAQLTIGIMSLIGLYQGIARDVFSYLSYHGTYDRAYLQFKGELANKRICSVPQYFYIFMSYNELMAVHKSREKDCLYIHGASGTGGIEQYNLCKLVPDNFVELPKFLSYGSKVFRSDSGYSYYVCPAP